MYMRHGFQLVVLLTVRLVNLTAVHFGYPVMHCELNWLVGIPCVFKMTWTVPLAQPLKQTISLLLGLCKETVKESTSPVIGWCPGNGCLLKTELYTETDSVVENLVNTTPITDGSRSWGCWLNMKNLWSLVKQNRGILLEISYIA